jgi:hypothetical protein
MGAAEHRFSLLKLVEFFFEGPDQNHLPQHRFSFRRIQHGFLSKKKLSAVVIGTRLSSQAVLKLAR